VDPDVLALEDNKAVVLTPETLTGAEKESDEAQDTAFENPAPASVGAHILMRNKADAEKLSKRKRAIRSIWAVPLLLLGGAIFLAIWQRQAIVEAFPKTATFYQAVGINVKSNGLDVQGLTSQRLVVDGVDLLRVNGEVVNLTSSAISSPPIQMRLENRSGEALVDWYVEVGTIAAGERITIETDYPSPPIDGVELRYRFAPENP
jgi:hypothetical protein